MKKLKVLSIILILLLTLAVMPSAASSAENMPIFEAIGLNVNLEEGKPITRYDLAKIAISLGGLNIIKTGSAVFVDVPEKHWAFPEVNTVSYYGYMEGLADGTFGIDSSASIADAAQILMNLLGYGSFAKQANWGIGEYLVRAKGIGLLNGIGSLNANLDSVSFKKMIINMLDKNIVTISSIGSNGIDFDVDETMNYLTSRYGYYFKEGTLQAVGKSAITGSTSVPAGKIKVGGVTYSANGKDYSSFLGAKVRIIIERNESNSKVLYMELSENYQSEELNILSKDILGFSGTTLTFLNEEGKTEKANISLTSQVILNGQRTTFDERYMQPFSGGLKLVDTNGDEIYDFVYVTYELFYEVSGSFKGEYIADAISATTLDLNRKEVYVYENGISSSIDSVKNEMIVSVMPGAISFDENGMPKVNNSLLTKATVELSVKKVSGVVSAKGTDSCIIDGIEYGYSKYYKMLMSNSKSMAPELNKYVVAYLNSDNCIVYTKLDVDAIVKNQSFKYAYALKMFRKNEISEDFYIKVFTEDAEILLLETAKEYKLNGDRTTAAKVLSNKTLYPKGTFSSQLITYELNEEGKVINIGVATDNTASADGYDILNFSKDFSDTKTYRNTFEHLYSFTDSSILFEIPKDFSEEKKFMVKVTAQPLVSNAEYTVSLYDVNEKYEVAVLLIDNSKLADDEGATETIRNLQFKHFYGLEAFVVESKMTIMNENGEERTELKGLTYSGNNMEVKRLIAVEDDLTDSEQANMYKRINQDKLTGTKWKDLGPGDVIHYETDKYGNVDRFRYVFKQEFMKDKDGKIIFTTNGNDKWHSTYLVVGVIDKVFADGNFLFRSSDVRNTTTLHKASPTAAQAAVVKIFIVEGGLIREGKSSELRYDEPAFFICEDGMVYDVIVYRD